MGIAQYLINTHFKCNSCNLFRKNNPSTYLGKLKHGTFPKPPKSGHTPFLGVNEHFLGLNWLS